MKAGNVSAFLTDMEKRGRDTVQWHFAIGLRKGVTIVWQLHLLHDIYFSLSLQPSVLKLFIRMGKW